MIDMKETTEESKDINLIRRSLDKSVLWNHCSGRKLEIDVIPEF